jgi:hypothetical protein
MHDRPRSNKDLDLDQGAINESNTPKQFFANVYPR